LDILRAFAILFVVFEHGNIIIKNIGIEIPSLDGVSIFFVLSGFLIGGILIKVIEKNGATFGVLTNFWIRRWFRTLPNYFLILTILVVMSVIIDGLNVMEVKKYFVFAQNFASIHPGFFPEAWSLSIEEWFYLLFPPLLFIVIALLPVNKKRAILFVAIFIIIETVFIRYYRYLNLNIETKTQWDDIFRKQVISRFDSLMFGVIGAYISFYYQEFWKKRSKLYFIAGLIILILHKYSLYLRGSHNLDFNSYYCVFSFSLSSIGTLLLIPYLTQVKSGKNFIYRQFTIISLISYSMYLINLSLVQRIIIPLLFKFINIKSLVISTLVQYIIYWVIVIVGSIIIYKYYEVPFMALRDKFKPFKLKHLFRKTARTIS